MKESVLTDAEKDSIEITKLIFHIIIEDRFDPIYLDELEITSEQKNFFKHRLIDASEGNQFVFKDKELSNVYNSCKEIIENPEELFVRKSKKLAFDFKSHHKKTTSDGVFLVSIVRLLNDKELIFLLKIDNKKVYQYIVKEGNKINKATMKEITDTFVEDKKSIQKVAIIDINNNYKWDVLARERNSESIRQYFMDFLQVQQRETNFDLTKKVVQSTRMWAQLNASTLPDDVSEYKTRALNYINTHTTFNTENFVESVIYEFDFKQREQYQQLLSDHLAEDGIAGQVFTIKPKAVSSKVTKNIRKTEEGVTIEWEGTATDKYIDIPTQKNADGFYHIKIKTKNIGILS
ncbi:MAG: nucleoid-associated protein [Salinivirgaceae bacterium]|nr:nucleoid-associated protein [Salinivirgaceae bacterium]